jgi:sigma-B regulation protein RsbU (phosphoserine phosphatase)
VENNHRILIVDDEPYNVDYLEQELDDLGYQSLSASNGFEALQVVEDEKPDLVLLDIMMPGMDGFEVLSRLKDHETNRHIPVIVISAMSDMDSIVRGIELGAEDYLPKPFDEVLLRARISSALEKKTLRDLEQSYLRSLEKELEIGHQIQTGFLPDHLPERDGWVLNAFFRPAREVAGDFYDVFELPDGKLVVLLGDVADKGVGSALYMALYRSLLRSSLSNVMQIDDPVNKLIRAVVHTNDYVCTTHEMALFVTLFISILDPVDGTLTYINAGHNPPLLLQSSGYKLIPRTGPALGIFEGQEFEAEQIQLNSGDRLFIYSDGLEDGKNPGGELYTSERLLESFLQEGATVEKIIGEIDQFVEDEPQYDDLTLLVLDRI